VNFVTAGLCAVLGLAAGSFLNVVIWRVPRGESVVHPRSHCPACDHELRVYDNVPVVSWLVLRGRCRDCGVHISARYPAIELLTAAVWGLVGFAFADRPLALPAFLIMSASLIAIAAIDLDHMVIPNRIIYPVAFAIVPLLVLASAEEPDWPALGRAALGSLLYGGLFFSLWYLGRGRAMGYGDVRLAFLLGLPLGWLGWSALVAGAFLPFLLGSVVGILLAAPWISVPMFIGGAAGWSLGASLVAADPNGAGPHAVAATGGAVLAGAVAFLVASRLRLAPRGRALPFGPAMALGCLVAAVAVAL
jgi:leader peptidase (prepilin peptidase)/N-methyltransferase